MPLHWLCLVQHIFELGLLELEVLFLERSLFACLRIGLGLTWSLQNETLVYICNEIVIHVLRFVLVYSTRLCILVTCVGQTAGQSHS